MIFIAVCSSTSLVHVENVAAMALHGLSNELLCEIFSYEISCWSNCEVSRERSNGHLVNKLLELKAEERGYCELRSYAAVNSTNAEQDDSPYITNS